MKIKKQLNIISSNNSKPYLKRIFSVLLIQMLIGSSSEANPNPPILDGHWLSDCRHGKISEMHIELSSSYLREDFYKEDNCLTKLFFIETTGLVNYPVAVNSEEASEVTAVDYSYDEISLTPMTESITEQFNRNSLCELNSWQVLAAQKITNKLCRFVDGARPIHIPHSGQELFGIFSITEPWLYFGQNNLAEDSSTPVRRPKVLQSEPFGKRN